MAGRELQILVGAMVLLGVLIFAGAGRLSVRTVSALGLTVALVGAFYLYIVIAPSTATSSVTSLALFVGSALLFRLLSDFESPR